MLEPLYTTFDLTWKIKLLNLLIKLVIVILLTVKKEYLIHAMDYAQNEFKTASTLNMVYQYSA